MVLNNTVTNFNEHDFDKCFCTNPASQFSLELSRSYNYYSKGIPGRDGQVDAFPTVWNDRVKAISRYSQACIAARRLRNDRRIDYAIFGEPPTTGR